MQSIGHQPLVHRFAIATTCLALAPIVVGAVVTTLDAGMAFPDWPSSDGYNMVTYPWLKSAGDKFVEHGHRLAGMTIGLVSIAFVLSTWLTKSRPAARRIALCVLLAVIVQGLLGGMRVLADERQLAMLHGSLAALVFALMGSATLLTSRAWIDPPVQAGSDDVYWLKPLALATPAIIFGQYLLGGLLRHQGEAMFEHAGMAVVVLLFVIATGVAAHRTGVAWLSRLGKLLCAIVVAQMALGIGTWITKFGFATLGYVAVQHSTQQVVMRTSHTVLGMLLFMTSVVFALRVLRVAALQRDRSTSASAEFTSFAGPLAPERSGG